MHYNSLHAFPEAITGAFSQASPYNVCPSLPPHRLRKKSFKLVKQSKKVNNSFKSGTPLRNGKIWQLNRCCQGGNPITAVHTLSVASSWSKAQGTGTCGTADLSSHPIFECQHASGGQQDMTAWVFAAISPLSLTFLSIFVTLYGC